MTMNVLLAIPAKNQNQYIADMVEAIEAQAVKPCHVLYMPDRPTGKDLVEARKLVGNNPLVELCPVSKRPEYVGRPQMNFGEDWFLTGHVRNEAIRYMDAHPEIDAVVFIDGDCIPEKELIKAHAELLDSDRPVVTVGQRKESLHQWEDQRCKDFSFIKIFNDEPSVVENEAWFVDSGVVWTCNFGMNRKAVDALRELNNTLYGRNETFSSDFLGTWGGEDGFIGLECFYSGIDVIALGKGNNGIRHKYHERHQAKYDHIKFVMFLEGRREELLYLLDLYGKNARNIKYVPRDTLLVEANIDHTNEHIVITA